ncbi:MAG: hypothetical protein QOG70_2720, partial [Solirubrobacteraceae bacterium]|nr:hypothetical protein [Solirubrobacteraceae bacterium]
MSAGRPQPGGRDLVDVAHRDGVAVVT